MNWKVHNEGAGCPMTNGVSIWRFHLYLSGIIHKSNAQVYEFIFGGQFSNGGNCCRRFHILLQINNAHDPATVAAAAAPTNSSACRPVVSIVSSGGVVAVPDYDDDDDDALMMICHWQMFWLTNCGAAN